VEKRVSYLFGPKLRGKRSLSVTRNSVENDSIGSVLAYFSFNCFNAFSPIKELDKLRQSDSILNLSDA
jgi:hypothetical protein